MRTKQERANSAAEDFVKARDIAAEVGVEVIAHTEHHYSFRGAGWVLNVYPTTLKIIPDAGQCKPPNIHLHGDWYLYDVAEAIRKAVSRQRQAVAESRGKSEAKSDHRGRNYFQAGFKVEPKRERPAPDEFMECAECAKADNDAVYCEACAHNVCAITGLQAELKKLQEQVAANEGFRPGFPPGFIRGGKAFVLRSPNVPAAVQAAVEKALAEGGVEVVSGNDKTEAVELPQAFVDAVNDAMNCPALNVAAVDRSQPINEFSSQGYPKEFKSSGDWLANEEEATLLMRQVNSQREQQAKCCEVDPAQVKVTFPDESDCGLKFKLEKASSGEENHGATKYQRRIREVSGPRSLVVDCYNILGACGVTRAPTAHAAKKLLYAGLRGKGDELRDLREARVALDRAIVEVEQEIADPIG